MLMVVLAFLWVPGSVFSGEIRNYKILANTVKNCQRSLSWVRRENKSNGLIFLDCVSEQTSEVGLWEMNITYRHWMTRRLIVMKKNSSSSGRVLMSLWSSLCQMCVLHTVYLWESTITMHCLKICAYKMSWKVYKNMKK